MDNLIKKMDIEKEIPEQFHTLVAKSAIIKSKKADSETIDYLWKNTKELMNELKNYFKTPKQFVGEIK